MPRSAAASVVDCTVQPATPPTHHLASVPQPQRRAAKSAGAREAIRQLVAAHPGKIWRIPDFVERTGFVRSAVAEACRAMMDEGELVRPAHGDYRAPRPDERRPAPAAPAPAIDPFVVAIGAMGHAAPAPSQHEEDDEESDAFDLDAPAPPRALPAVVLPLPDVRGLELWQKQVAWCAAAAAGNRQAAGLLLKSIDGLIWAFLRRMAARAVVRGHALTDEDVEDMHAEAQIVIVQRAIPRFEPERGYRFITYALWWIRSACNRWLSMHSRQIRIPVGLVEAMGRVTRARQQLRQVLGRSPTAEELSQFSRLPVGRVRRLMESGRVVASLEAPVRGGRNGSAAEEQAVADLIADPAPNAEQLLASEDPWRAETVRRALEGLTPRERAVVEARYQGDHTLSAIGEAVDLSRERIRQIEDKALRKLRWRLRGLAPVGVAPAEGDGE